jgi:hypothetical protein
MSREFSSPVARLFLVCRGLVSSLSWVLTILSIRLETIMKFKKHSSNVLICGVAAALSLLAVPAAAEQEDAQLTVAFISDAAQGKSITKEQYTRAIVDLEDETEKGVRGFYVANNLCVSYLKTGEVEQAQLACDAAVERIQQLIEKSSKSARRGLFAREYGRLFAIALSNRGVINYINDEPELARDDFESAIEMDSSVRQALVNLTRITELASTTT